MKTAAKSDLFQANKKGAGTNLSIIFYHFFVNSGRLSAIAVG